MSGGLYSMEEKDYDKNLNLKAIKPYGDTMNDGKVQPQLHTSGAGWRRGRGSS